MPRSSSPGDLAFAAALVRAQGVGLLDRPRAPQVLLLRAPVRLQPLAQRFQPHAQLHATHQQQRGNRSAIAAGHCDELEPQDMYSDSDDSDGSVDSDGSDDDGSDDDDDDATADPPPPPKRGRK